MSTSSLITNDAFIHLTHLRTLYMYYCFGITDDAFVHLKELHHLVLVLMDSDQFTGEGFVHLKELRSLNIGGDGTPCKIKSTAFDHLDKLNALYINDCTEITDTAFVPLKHLEILKITNCPKINGSGFVHLNNIKRIRCTHYNEDTDEALQPIADAMVALHAHARANAIEPVAHEAMVAVA
jgi:hypothetical protein